MEICINLADMWMHTVLENNNRQHIGNNAVPKLPNFGALSAYNTTHNVFSVTHCPWQLQRLTKLTKKQAASLVSIT